MAKKVTSYEAEDGSLFNDSASAETHERDMVFDRWYRGWGTNCLVEEVDSCDEPVKVTPSTLRSWIKKHRVRVLELLYVYDPDQDDSATDMTVDDEGPDHG